MDFLTHLPPALTPLSSCSKANLTVAGLDSVKRIVVPLGVLALALVAVFDELTANFALESLRPVSVSGVAGVPPPPGGGKPPGPGAGTGVMICVVAVAVAV